MSNDDVDDDAMQVGLMSSLEQQGRLQYMCMGVADRPSDRSWRSSAGVPSKVPTWRIEPGVCLDSLAMQVKA